MPLQSVYVILPPTALHISPLAIISWHHDLNISVSFCRDTLVDRFPISDYSKNGIELVLIRLDFIIPIKE